MTSRPRYHFTPPENFMNDPNGLIFYDGEYHLFYQYNPFGDVWGHMSWGHAVSRDLVHWQHLPVALHEEDGVMIFSGSAVVDWQNTSGFGSPGNPPLIAIYTGHSESEQTQNIAYSTDRGRTWTKYEGNPVIAIGSREFRDPKVFWHEPTGQWIMVTVLSDRHKVRFDGSPDLKRWTHLSDFGPAGATDGLWECPDLFPLPIEGEPKNIKWVLKVDALRGTGAQYFTGDFDGARFTNDSPDYEIKRVEYGDDFYAAQSWCDEPNERRIWIGWLNNWHYANAIPTTPWRGLFSIPRQLSLRKAADGLNLVQQPIEELHNLRQSLYHVTNIDIATANTQLTGLKLDLAQEISVEFTVGTALEFGLKLCTGASEETIIGYDAQQQQLSIDRRQSGESAFSDRFAGIHRSPLQPEAGRIRLHIFVDSCSVEVFCDDGYTAMSDLIFPQSQNLSLRFYASGEHVHLNALDIWNLR
ncbi:MAG TPA: glycoside hydrolase family 32 protein [Anaerolineales bacterium]|nr:glycoside hydrolase family 32 protein [Anaerolineales bacterium]